MREMRDELNTEMVMDENKWLRWNGLLVDHIATSYDKKIDHKLIQHGKDGR